MYWVFLLLISSFSLSAAPAIVFVHLGKSLPQHVAYSIAQAKKFNPDCPIYLVGSQDALWRTDQKIEATLITAESLPTSREHEFFRSHSRLNRSSANGLWFYSTERFFCVQELMRSRNLTDVIHLENDVLLYADLNELLPAFQTHYRQMIGATFEEDERCVPGILYIPDVRPLDEMLRYINLRAAKEETDMSSLAKFKEDHGGIFIAHLPTIPPEYVRDYQPLATLSGFVSKESASYANHFEEFQSLFDAACCGIFVGGDDSTYHANPDSGPGRIHPSSMLQMSRCGLEWGSDSCGREIPFLIYKDRKFKLNNLHITNKTLIPKMVYPRGNE